MPNQISDRSKIKRIAKRVLTKQSAWTCSCGLVVPKKWALLSGDPTHKYGYHIHCPRCGKTIAQYVNPKETQ